MAIGTSNFTAGQTTFISRLAGDTGLDVGVVAAWLYLEENGSAAQSREAAGNFDWLNIGYTDSATLGAGNSAWKDPTTAADLSAQWLQGKVAVPGFGHAAPGIVAFSKTAGQPATTQVRALQVSGWASSGYPDFLSVLNGIDQGFILTLGGKVSKGGVAGLGGTGTTPSTPSPTQLTIGQTGNPNEDYWTGINRLASDVSWYLFSDGERLYYMDGADLIVQTPAAYIDRVKDADTIQHLSLTYDNTAFQYSSTHKRKQHVQHKTRLAHVSSPTEARLDIICPVDFYRGGDVVVLSSCGIGDGRWLVSDVTRSVFQIFSSLTLVPPIMPLSEAQAVGTTGASTGGAKTGTSIVNPKTGKTAGGKGGYQNPFPGGWTPSRLDMGYDGTFTNQIVAPIDGTITYAASSFSNWGGYVELKASGTIPGLQTDTLYFAEGVAPLVSAGQQVTAGTPICRAVPSPWNGISGNIEWGPAISGTMGSPTNPLGTAVGDPVGMVLAFAKWAEQTLGVAPPATTGDAGHF